MRQNLTNRISWIDAAKGIGLLCVILGHFDIPLVFMFTACSMPIWACFRAAV